jgi:1-phosphofructokinase family hexose kinase
MLVVGANPTLDRTLALSTLTPGAVLRATSARVTAGGKAVNVCRSAAALGLRAQLVAHLPGRVGAMAADLLAAEGHDVTVVSTTGELRSAIVILEDDGRTTVVNEPGQALARPERKTLVEAVESRLVGQRVLVLSGSVPPSAEDLYRELVIAARSAGVFVIVDAAQEALLQALPAGPDLVTPNLAEAQAVLGLGSGTEGVLAADDARAHALAAGDALIVAGARTALVTAGHHGAAYCTPRGRFWFDAPRVPVVNPIGAGDALVGGIAVALENGIDPLTAIGHGICAGSASVTTALAGHVDSTTYAALFAVRPRPVEESR